MAWIKQTSNEKASGLLKQLFAEALTRAGRVWNITRVMSVNPPVMRDSIRLYTSVMIGESTLSRIQRELLATVVSHELECHY